MQQRSLNCNNLVVVRTSATKSSKQVVRDGKRDEHKKVLKIDGRKTMRRKTSYGGRGDQYNNLTNEKHQARRN